MLREAGLPSGNFNSADEARQTIFRIVAKYAPRSLSITDDVELLKDVRVWGDDASDLLREFADECGVDMRNFVFSKFFRDEGAYLINDMIKKIGGSGYWLGYPPIKVSHLLDVAMNGRWRDPS
jgi:Protein of unknown function (DUF1493).